MSNYLISLHHPEYGLTLFKDGFTGNHRLDDDGLPHLRMKEFMREYGRYGWVVTFHSNLTLDDDRKTYHVEQVAQILMGIKGLDYFPTKKMAQALGIHSGWTEIFMVSLPQLQGYQGKAVQICAGMDWNNKRILGWRKAMCMKHFGVDSWGEYKYGEKVYRTTPFNGRYNITHKEVA